jgi:hypothetical protein
MAYERGNTSSNDKPKYQHKENRGSMFDNDHKETEKHPDLTGSVNVNGVVYWINGWKSETQSGKRKLSLSVQRQDERQPERHAAPAAKKSAW